MMSKKAQNRYGDSDGPYDPDGPWADGWSSRNGCEVLECAYCSERPYCKDYQFVRAMHTPKEEPSDD